MTNVWNNRRLKFLFNARIGGAWGNEPEEGNSVICIRAADFDSQRIRHKEVDLTKRSYTIEEIEKKKLNKGDLIIEKSGGGENQPAGRIVLFNLDELALCSNFLEILRPNPAIIDSTFCAYLLFSLWLNKSTIPSIKQTTGIQNLDLEEYLDLKVKVPNIQEQKSIAAYLDQETARIDALIAAKERLLTLLAEKRQALITKAVTRGLDPHAKMKDSGVEWLGEVPEGWEVKKLKYAVIMRSGENLKSEDISEDGKFPVYGGNGYRGMYHEHNHDGHYVLIGRQGALCGNINYAEGKFWATEHAVVITITDGSNTKYLGELLRIMNLNQYSISAAQPGLSVEVISNLKIPSPVISEQNEIVEYLQRETFTLDSLQTATNRSIGLLKERRAALISAAVTGQLKI